MLDFDGGFVKQFRAHWDDPVFRSELEVAAFLWMVGQAQWRDATIKTKFGAVQLLAGELITSERVLSAKFCLHRNTLRSLLSRLVSEGIISIKEDQSRDRLGTIYRIENYASYQGSKGSENVTDSVSRTSKRTDPGPVQDQSRTKNKEGKESNELNLGTPPTEECAPGDGDGSSAQIPATEPRQADLLGDVSSAHAPRAGSAGEQARIVEAWNVMARGTGLGPPIKKLDTDQLKALKARFNQVGVDGVYQAIRMIGESQHLHGRNSINFRADMDFLLRPKNIRAVLAGTYSDEAKGFTGPNRNAQRQPYQSPGQERSANARDILDKIRVRDAPEVRPDDFEGQTLDHTEFSILEDLKI